MSALDDRCEAESTAPVDRRVALALFLLAGLSFAPFALQYQIASINDEGLLSLGASRMWAGQAIYRDFNTHIAPGSYCWALLFYSLLGPTVVATRLAAAVLTGALALLVYLLARICLPPRWALAPYVMFVCAGVTQWPILSYHWAGVATFLLGTWTLWLWLRSPRPVCSLACGASAALALWTLQSEAAALLLLTALVALVWRARMSARSLALWVVGCGTVSVILWGPILLHTRPAEVYRQNVVWALGHNASQGRSPYTLSHLSQRWLPFLEQAQRAPWTGPVLLWMFQSCAYLLIWTTNYGCFYPVFLLACWFAYRHRDEGLTLLVLAQLASILAWSSRQTLLYLNFLTPLLFVLLVVLVRRLGRWGAPLVAAWCSCYLVGYLFWWSEARQFRFPIHTVRGTLFAQDAREAQLVQKGFEVALKLTPPGTRAFCYPYAMGFYYLSGVQPVGPLSSVIPLLGEDSEVPHQLQELERYKVEWIYQFPWSNETLHAVPYVDQQKFWRLVEEYDGKFLQSATPVADLGIGRLYRRDVRP